MVLQARSSWAQGLSFSAGSGTSLTGGAGGNGGTAFCAGGGGGGRRWPPGARQPCNHHQPRHTLPAVPGAPEATAPMQAGGGAGGNGIEIQGTGATITNSGTITGGAGGVGGTGTNAGADGEGGHRHPGQQRGHDDHQLRHHLRRSRRRRHHPRGRHPVRRHRERAEPADRFDHRGRHRAFRQRHGHHRRQELSDSPSTMPSVLGAGADRDLRHQHGGSHRLRRHLRHRFPRQDGHRARWCSPGPTPTPAARP